MRFSKGGGGGGVADFLGRKNGTYFDQSPRTWSYSNMSYVRL